VRKNAYPQENLPGRPGGLRLARTFERRKPRMRGAERYRPPEAELLFVVDGFAVKLFAVGKFSLGFHRGDLAVLGDFNFGGADLLASFFQSGCDLVAGDGLKRRWNRHRRAYRCRIPQCLCRHIGWRSCRRWAYRLQ